MFMWQETVGKPPTGFALKGSSVRRPGFQICGGPEDWHTHMCGGVSRNKGICFLLTWKFLFYVFVVYFLFVVLISTISIFVFQVIRRKFVSI